MCKPAQMSPSGRCDVPQLAAHVVMLFVIGLTQRAALVELLALRERPSYRVIAIKDSRILEGG